MAYCNSCGAKRVEDNKFCLHCGANFKNLEESTDLKEEKDGLERESNEDIEHVHQNEEPVERTSEQVVEESVVSPEEDTAKEVTNKTEKEKKKVNKWIPIMIVFGLILFGVHKYFEYHYSFERKLVKINEALSNNDTEELFKLISVEKDVPLNKEGYLKGLDNNWVGSDLQLEFEYYSESQKENPSLLNQEIGALDGPQFIVKPKNVLFGLYTDYNIHAKPEEIGFESLIENTELDIEGEKFTLEKAGQGADFLIYPYQLKIKAKGKNSFGEFSDEITLDQSELQDNYVHIDFNGEMYDLSYNSYEGNFGDAHLYVNGEDTKLKLKDLDEIGPIPKDKSIEVFAVLNEQVSNVVRMPNDLQSIYFEFDTDIKMDINKVDDVAAGALVLSFRDAYERAMNYLEYDYIEDYLEANSAAAKGLKEFIDEHPRDYYSYDFELNEVLEVKKGKDNLVHVKTREIFDFYDGNKEHHYDRKKTYDLIEKNGEYLIRKINYDETNKN